MIIAETIDSHTVTEALKSELAEKQQDFADGVASIRADIGLLFFTPPNRFAHRADALLAALENDFAEGDAVARSATLDVIFRLALGLSSTMTCWNLGNRQRSGKSALNALVLEAWARRFGGLLRALIARDAHAEQSALLRWQQDLAARYQVEGLSDLEAAAAAAAETRQGLPALLATLSRRVQESNVRFFVRHRLTEMGNDYGRCLDYPLLLGASFVTTNPPLVLFALKQGALPPDELAKACAARPEWMSPAAIASRLVVRQNAVALRPIFLLTGGRKGYVCLQVDPRYTTAADIVREARYQYEALGRELGGIPNVVFKLPATHAGLEACRALGEMGIGSTATVCFSIFQGMAFAAAMAKSKALVSYVVVMNGRLAGPVTEELKPDDAWAGRFAGVAVAKKLQRLFYAAPPLGQGYDPAQVRILIASIRNYDGEIPDIEDVLGTPVISIFPDMRRAFDARPRNLEIKRVDQEMDAEVLAKLAPSEIFRQAYYLPGDPDRFRPEKPLLLAQDKAVQDWTPVRRTLDAFMNAYQQAESLLST